MFPPLFPKTTGTFVFGFDHGFPRFGQAPRVQHNASKIPCLMADSQESGVEQQYFASSCGVGKFDTELGSMRRLPYCPKSLRR